MINGVKSERRYLKFPTHHVEKWMSYIWSCDAHLPHWFVASVITLKDLFQHPLTAVIVTWQLNLWCTSSPMELFSKAGIMIFSTTIGHNQLYFRIQQIFPYCLISHEKCHSKWRFYVKPGFHKSRDPIPAWIFLHMFRSNPDRRGCVF